MLQIDHCIPKQLPLLENDSISSILKDLMKPIWYDQLLIQDVDKQLKIQTL